MMNFYKAFFLLGILSFNAFSQSKTEFKFDFGSGKTAKGYTQVSAESYYSKEKGFGFMSNSKVESINHKSKNALTSDFCTSNQPFFFTVDIPEGNYNIKVILGDIEGESTTTVKVENRRLMLEKVTTAKVVVGQAPESDDFRHVLREELLHGGKRHGVHLGDDAPVVRRCDLRPVGKVGLEAVVVRRIVAGRDDDTRMRLQMAHGEAELRGRARAVENDRLAAQPRPGGSSQLAEVPGEVAHVVCNDDLGLRRALLRREVFGDVAVQADHGPGQRELVEQVAAHGRVLGTAGGGQHSGLGLGRDLAAGAATHPAGAEFQVAVKAVVELGPLAALNELDEALLRPGRQAGLQPGIQVIGGARQQFAVLGGLFDLSSGGHGNYSR